MKTGIYWQDPKYALRPGQDFIFDPSLVLYLPLHKLDGASIMSRDACGHLCSVTGALWTPRGRSFDGDDDSILLGTDVWSSAELASGTICFWVKPDEKATTANIIDFEDYTALVLQRDGGTQRFYSRVDGTWLDSTVIGTDGVWYHLVFTWDGSDQYLYVDGVLKATNATGSPDLDTPSGAVRIGSNNGGVTGMWAGLIDEAVIYNRALTPLEIQRNYLASKGRYQ